MRKSSKHANSLYVQRMNAHSRIEAEEFDDQYMEWTNAMDNVNVFLTDFSVQWSTDDEVNHSLESLKTPRTRK